MHTGLHIPYDKRLRGSKRLDWRRGNLGEDLATVFLYLRAAMEMMEPSP